MNDNLKLGFIIMGILLAVVIVVVIIMLILKASHSDDLPQLVYWSGIATPSPDFIGELKYNISWCSGGDTDPTKWLVPNSILTDLVAFYITERLTTYEQVIENAVTLLNSPIGESLHFIVLNDWNDSDKSFQMGFITNNQ